MEEVNTTQAVDTTTEAPVTESAPVEESTVEATVEATEKSEITTEEEQGSQAEDQMIPKHRLDEVIKERNELRELKAEIEAERLEKERQAAMTPELQAQTAEKEKAKELLKEMGFVTREESAAEKAQETAKNMFISECNRLEAEYDGKNGMPKFESAKVAEFMDKQAQAGNLISDPGLAFKIQNLDAIAEAKAKMQNSSTYSEKQSGGINEVTDGRSADLEAASQTGNFTEYLKKYAGMPKN